MKTTLCFGIETSCDETSCAVVADGRIILSNVIASQANMHAQYGGVVPELASRRHVELILPTIRNALIDAGVSYSDLDVVGVTKGPGLVGALLVGLSAAKGMCEVANLPLIGVHHIEGHIAANYLSDSKLVPPFICLVVSGGHSHLVHVAAMNRFIVLGRTRDDAAGEAFDKIARALDLGYPGGPAIEKAAVNGDPYRYKLPKTTFEGTYDFSFSGLKTACLQIINQAKMKGERLLVEDLCASFQMTIVSTLIQHTLLAAQACGCDRICLAGGVGANQMLRQSLKDACDKTGHHVSFPPPILCTDNAAMIASAAYYRYCKGKIDAMDLNALPTIELDQII